MDTATKIIRHRTKKCAGVWSLRAACRNGGPGHGTYLSYVRGIAR